MTHLQHTQTQPAGTRDRHSRRGFLGSMAGSSLGATLGLGSAPAGLAAGGFFAHGAERIRVGLIGCGGRGTGAALQAAAADPAVRIVALGDAFPDQVASSAHVLARDAAGQFACPPEQRFVGERAYLDVLESGVDVVLLAAPPHVRPLHVTAAVRAGKHLFCEKPAAIDLPGAHEVAAACAAARRQKLAVVSGLCLRRDESTCGLIGTIRDGAVGQLLQIHAHAALGLPWQKPIEPGWTAAEWRQRNWISFGRFSGGAFVEHHIHAIDRGLWALGDACPVAAVAAQPPRLFSDHRSGRHAGWAIGDCHDVVAVRYTFADGSEMHASCGRGVGLTKVADTVAGTLGRCDLHASPGSARLPAVGMYQSTMNALMQSVRSGIPVDDGTALCHSTLVAIMGRMAATAGRPIHWNEIVRRSLPVFPAPTIGSGLIEG